MRAVYVISSLYDHISTEIQAMISGDIQSANRTISSITFPLAMQEFHHGYGGPKVRDLPSNFLLGFASKNLIVLASGH
jgi:hypothetical protein